MDSYITGKELIERLKAEPFQLFDLIHNGLQPYSWHGKKIVDINKLPLEKAQTKEEILKLVRIENGAYRTQFGGGAPGLGRKAIQKHLTDEEIEQEAQKRYEKQPTNIPIIPNDCIAKNIDLPIDERKAKAAIDEALSLRFKEEDVIKYEGKHLKKEHADFDSVKREALASMEITSGENIETSISSYDLPKSIRMDDLAYAVGKWTGRFDVIEKIFLYPVDAESEPSKYVICAVAPPKPPIRILPDYDFMGPWREEEIIYDKTMAYYEWFEDETCCHIEKDLRKAYKDSKNFSVWDWMWLPVTPEESGDMDGFNAYGEDPFIVMDKGWEIFPNLKPNGDSIPTAIEPERSVEVQQNSQENLSFSKNADAEMVMRELTISVEDDTQIKIQHLKKKEFRVNAAELGYNGKRTAWIFFIKAIRENDGQYFNFSQSDKKQRESDRKNLAAVGKKLIERLSEEFNISFPPKYKIYDYVNKGKFRFKFQIKLDISINVKQKKQRLEYLAGEYEETQHPQTLKEIEELVNELRSHDAISNEEALELIGYNPKQGKVDAIKQLGESKTEDNASGIPGYQIKDERSI